MDIIELKNREEEFRGAQEQALTKAGADAFASAKEKTLEPVLAEIAARLCEELSGSKKLSKEKRRTLKASDAYRQRYREETAANELIRQVREASDLKEIPQEVRKRFEKHYSSVINRLRTQYLNEAGKPLSDAVMEILAEVVENNTKYQVQETLITRYWGIISYTFRKKRVNISTRRYAKNMLSAGNYKNFMSLLAEENPIEGARYKEHFLLGFAGSKARLEKEIEECVSETGDERIQEIERLRSESRIINNLVGNRIADAGLFRRMEKEILKILSARLTPDAVRSMLKENPYYETLLEDVIRAEEEEVRIKTGILTAVPENLIDLYPLARRIRRHFFIHVGPTNSGKSHDALEALKMAQHGIYLAPLRLLAYEKYEELNLDGVPCDMKTGEEELAMPGARVRSCTIEILDIKERYDIAVIDEGQLVGDPERGRAWTEAILGVRADEIHICTAPEGLEIIKTVIEECQDDYTVLEHKRFTPLKMEQKPFHFPADHQKGDCYIVFSRKSVHACAEKLRRRGAASSIIYGALPYDVRRNEAKRFITGQTDMVTATDAVGMGLNLPIRRIVFLEETKFDGKCRRELNAGEIRQIAGRAGRYGVFEEGFVNVDASLNKARFRELLDCVPEDVKQCFIGFPDSLLGIEGPISATMEQWQKMRISGNFKKAPLNREIRLCRRLEQISDDKELIYQFVRIPFDEENRELFRMWIHMFHCVRSNIPYNYALLDMPLPKELSELELRFRQLDLLYYFTDNFVKSDIIQVVLETKREVSARISRLLEKQY